MFNIWNCMSLFEILYFPGDKSVLITKPPVVSTTGGFRFFTFFKNAEGFGEQRVPQLESVVGIHFRRGKDKVFMELCLYTSVFSSKPWMKWGFDDRGSTFRYPKNVPNFEKTAENQCFFEIYGWQQKGLVIFC